MATLTTATATEAAAASEFRVGWPVVLACFGAAVFAWGFAAFAPAVYLAELQREYGWSAGLIGGGTTLAFLVGAGLLPFVSAVIDRFGARAVMISGVLLIGAGAIGVSHTTAPWQLYLWNLAIGCGWAGASSTAISTVLSKHFDHRRGLALSLALTGASAGGFAVAPALVALSYRFGLASAVSGLALVLLMVVVPVVWIGLRPSRGAGGRHGGLDGLRPMLPDLASRTAALRDRRFWSVAVPFALAIAAQVGMMVFGVSYLLPLLGADGTSLALFCTSLAGALGRLAIGGVIDRLPPRPLAAATFATQALGVSLMIALPGSPAALYLGSIAFGIGMGNVVALPSLVIQREFAPASFGLALGLSTAIGQVAYSLSPVALGLVRDVTGGYAATLAVCALLQAAAALAILRRTARRPAE
jgi:MFS family permease